MKWILQSKKDHGINECDEAGYTALMWVSEFRYEKMVQMLLDKNADVNARGGEYGNAL